ncbi:ribonucleoside-diphosphate reductase alpha chain [Ardenticatena maritima]|uniref:Vitamin B12-dependent ribonucleotide reductase n=1 Tax=Ardenticatena maritima TaxID=872965 RepID=A0A0M8K8F7_9CHLR|nr:adenosylcobalamin-dependent ribonucleoside-diphosphate reductase [Ardenticatena maritima]GAP62882.1 ribonucleoside-diphosphate reductase alpha chain [Ardenticatena maritima]
MVQSHTPTETLETPPVPEHLLQREIPLTENARKVLEKRYLRKGLDGKPIETIHEMFWRVAWHVAAAEDVLGGDRQKWAETFFDMLTRLEFLPNSPTFTGAGTPLGQLAACFTADMRVATIDGLKRIADLQVGDLVLTHQGRFRPVTQTMQRSYNGPLYRIKVKLIGTTLEVTPEHPLLTPTGWTRVEDLRVGDKVAVGFPQGEIPAPTFDLAELPFPEEIESEATKTQVRARRPATYQHSGRQSQWCRRFITLTPEFARLCGYYVAEGTIDTEGRYVRFTLSTEEREYQRDIVNLIESTFGISPTVNDSQQGRWTNIDLYSRTIATWFQAHFGRGSAHKRLPAWLLFASREVQEEFLVGLFRGDGLFFERIYTVKGRKSPKTFRSFRITLANPGLVHQIWQMVLRLGYHAAIRPTDTTYVTPNASETAQVSMPPLQSRDLIHRIFGIELPEPDERFVRTYVTEIDGRPFFEIERIEIVPFSGTVYNCEVAEDHSYITEGIAAHNCFVLPIEDDMGKIEGGIFDTLRNAALIQQTGGGNGFSFSRLRPKGAPVHSSAGIATGPVGFLRVYDKAFGEIAQGGSRRGANMGVLRVDHPDIREFISCKAQEGELENFNISVAITDAFMEAVKNDAEFELVSPQDGSVWERVRARELFDEIVKYAHHNGEPGVLFIDAANRDNPVPHLYELEATNPCGEQWLGPYENCCLGSVNLARHLAWENGRARLDWEKLAQTVRKATRFLDDVVTANKYVPAVPELREAAERARRIGLGIMGLADVLYALRVRYGSPEGQELAAQIMEWVRYHAMLTSIELAQERGPFPAIEGSIYDPNNLKWQPPTPLEPYTHDWGRPAVEWERVVEGIKRHGIRNAAQTTIAPTGTLSTVSGVEGYGCEPVFALSYVRHVSDGDKTLDLYYFSPLFEQALTHEGVDEETRTRIKEAVALTGSCQNVEGVPEALRHVFVVASDITPEEHVRMQAALQRFVDNSISKTINFPETATVEDVAKAYFLAWELGCKGITVYVTGSREKVVLETKKTLLEKKGEKASDALKQSVPVYQAAEQQTAQRKARPRSLTGTTYFIHTPLGKAYVTVNRDEEGQPFEVFANVGKAGSDIAAVSEAIGRLISLILRLPSPMSPEKRLEEVIDQLSGIGGGRPMGFGANRVLSLPDALARVLKEDLQKHGAPVHETGNGNGSHAPTPPPSAEQPDLFRGVLNADICPDCGHASLVNEEGCRKCYSCGYSEC